MDPCLDDCVEFAKKLQRLDKEVTLDILEGLPHGFLNFTKVCYKLNYIRCFKIFVFFSFRKKPWKALNSAF